MNIQDLTGGVSYEASKEYETEDYVRNWILTHLKNDDGNARFTELTLVAID